MKSASLSVRVDDDDAAFLAGLEIGDARTPSEKLRALLRAERKRHEGVDDPVEAAEMFRDLLRPAKRATRKLEAEAGMRSDFLTNLYEHLPDFAGAAFSGPKAAGKDAKGRLTEFESALLDEIFAYFQETLELGLTTRNRCYDPSGVEQRLAPLLELFELIKMSKHRHGDDKNG